jgi:hypothetical protein
MKTWIVWIVWLCGVLYLSAGCAAHEARCAGRLQPINVSTEVPSTTREGSDTRSRREE